MTPLSQPSGPHDWFWSVWCCGFLLATGLTIAAWANPYLPGDVGLARAVQTSGFPAGLADALNTIGGGLPSLLVVVFMAAVLLVAHRRDLATIIIAGSLLGLVSAPLKVLTDRPRPVAPLMNVAHPLSDRSFPSGHVLHVVLSFGLFAALLGATSMPPAARRVVQAGCVVVVGLMGVARVFVGDHWPSDVLGGYLWGALILAATLRVARVMPVPRSALPD